MTSVSENILNRLDENYRKKLEERMAQLKKYWGKNPGATVKIALPQEERDVIKSSGSGKQTGKEWSDLPKDIQDKQTYITNDITWKVMQRNPLAFSKGQYEYMQRYAKSDFKVQPLYKISKI
mgnify:CR=1 FL=1